MSRFLRWRPSRTCLALFGAIVLLCSLDFIPRPVGTTHGAYRVFEQNKQQFQEIRRLAHESRVEAISSSLWHGFEASRDGSVLDGRDREAANALIDLMKALDVVALEVRRSEASPKLRIVATLRRTWKRIQVHYISNAEIEALGAPNRACMRTSIEYWFVCRDFDL